MGEEAKSIKLPIIDLTTPDRVSTAASIRQACIESGFFYIVNHGVEQDLLERLFDESRKFFLLPVEEKMKLARKELRGYSAMYAEKLDPTTGGDPNETFLAGSVDCELSKLNQWPSEKLLPNMRTTVEEYHRKSLTAAKTLLPLIALALNLEDEKFFIRAKDSPMPFLRLLHYPGSSSCSSKDILGASAHSDFGMVTLLASDGVPGLQVSREKDQHPRVWQDVPHIEGALIVNIGDLMERWTNCLFRSTLHRVNPKGKERFSVPWLRAYKAVPMKQIPLDFLRYELATITMNVSASHMALRYTTYFLSCSTFSDDDSEVFDELLRFQQLSAKPTPKIIRKRYIL